MSYEKILKWHKIPYDTKYIIFSVVFTWIQHGDLAANRVEGSYFSSTWQPNLSITLVSKGIFLCTLLPSPFVCKNMQQMHKVIKWSWKLCRYSSRWTVSCPKSTHVSKSQHGDKIPTFEPQKIHWSPIKVRLWLFYITKKSWNLCCKLGLRFLLNPTLNTSPDLHLEKVLPCRRPCHTWDIELVSQLPSSQQPRLHKSPYNALGLRTWVPTSMLSTADIARIGLQCTRT